MGMSHFLMFCPESIFSGEEAIKLRNMSQWSMSRIIYSLVRSMSSYA